ncbi:MAG: cobyric acid synthase [Corynebacterium sp.]|nr:cobyric acid synthase [Corynebacterium sp.]
MVAFLVAGCTSDAGKSVVVAGLCRALRRRGLSVAPFKAQNMSNNSVVTPDGGEIGRAQALQAVACDLEPSILFNPILLKPGSDKTSQLIVHGQAQGNVSATSYIEHRTQLRQVAVQALQDLESTYDIVVCEGAGSPAEINLRATDIANFGLAAAAKLPVYIVGDIDRGGVLAHFFGTYHIVSEADQALIRGFIVNKFRGDQSILDPGLVELANRTGIPTVAVLPYIHGLWVDAEDSLQAQVGATIGPQRQALGTQRIRIAAVRLPRISNTTDVEALACEPGVSVTWTTDPDYIAEADIVVLPGSKATVSDLAWLRKNGIAHVLTQRGVENKHIVGFCGGFQMMCTSITDPIESHSIAPVLGLGLFDADIAFSETKTLVRHDNGAYEVHHGQVVRSAETTWIDHDCVNGNLFGTHIHGMMENDAFRREWLRDCAGSMGKTGFIVSETTSFATERLNQLETIADVIEKHWDVDQLMADLHDQRG